MEIPTPKFLLGDRVWLADGRSGVVGLSNFNAAAGEWLYAATNLPSPLRESQLFDFDPTEEFIEAGEPIAPLPSVSVDVSDLEEALERLDERVRQLSLDFGLLQQGLNEEAVKAIAEEAAAVVGLPIALDVASLRREAEAIHGAQSDVLRDLESAITLGLSQIGTRLDTLEANALSATGLSLTQLFISLGGFIRNPLAFILDKSAQEIIEGIQDGIDLGLSNNRS